MQDFSGFICSLFVLHQLQRFCNSRLHCNSRFNGDELLITKQVSPARSRGSVRVNCFWPPSHFKNASAITGCRG